MCGIAGILADDEGLVREALPRMVAALRHRGPDDEGLVYRRFGARTLGLGHRRLAILDLSPLGHQPMTRSPSGGCVTYNGAIYNYRPLRRHLEGLGDAVASQSDP